ncbi:TetR/AcrR family transcriptional regulator [Streptomyces sp. NBC_00525]|uniref:TetR/AcrR family transcriptional regulator n=1 Tax=Streptomyces sp. NBC_00525 TaxID=2903660 RepID=UPI002E8104FE|nr:TetR/AcrR family transcriptional regulator [Streptomyces sp. NBC_00525]WUC92292.1 TetR/AcrR family transcriptional regulator [Streptomyces sp. NBC_00525]
MDHSSSLRERLIDAGVELVTAEGSAAVGLREIARRAGVSHGAPRRYFPTHHSLLSAIARRGFADLAARLAAATNDPRTPRGRLRALSEAYLEYARDNRGMFELMFRHDLLDSEAHADATPPEAGTPVPPRLRDSSLPLFAGLVELVTLDRAHRAAHADTGPSNDPAPPSAVTAAALWTNLHGLAVLRAGGGLRLALETALPDAGDGPDPLVSAVLDAHLGRVRT